MVEKSKKKQALGFPPPLLGKQPFRLPLLAETSDLIALDKPASIGVRPYPWDDTPDLDTALNVQLDKGKPELLRTGASLFGSVYYLDPEISGVALFAKNRDALDRLRNDFGSGDFKVSFRFLSAQNTGLDSVFRADAPLLSHRTKPKMIPSTAKGKKSFTDFKRLADSGGGWTLWEARADFFRPHQVRAHAATNGIPVLGDALYDGPAAPTVRQLQPRARRSDMDAPVFRGLAAHLSKIEFCFGDEEIAIESPLPKPLSLLLKRMDMNY